MDIQRKILLKESVNKSLFISIIQILISKKQKTQPETMILEDDLVKTLYEII